MYPRFTTALAAFSLSLAAISAADVIDASLRFRYNFDAAPVADAIVDSSPSATHPGQNTGAVWIASEVNRSGVMDFSALGKDRITVPAIPALNSPQGTIAFWIKTPGGGSGPGEYAAILMDRRTTRGDVITLTDDGTLFVQVREGGANANVITGSALLNDNQWHHVAYVYDQSAAGSISLYVDGVLDASQPNTTAWGWPGTQQLEIGSSHDTFWRVFDGLMDDFLIYNRQLTESEITALAAGNPVTGSSLVLRLNFDTAPAANVVVDSSGSNNPGANAGATWVAADGTHSGVMRFELPTRTQIMTPSAPDLDATTGTIAFWMKSAGNTGEGDFASMIMDRRTGGVGDVITMADDGTIFVQAQSAGPANSFFTQAKVNDNAWHHVAYVYDQSETGFIKIYIDGAVSGSNNNSREWSWPIDQPLEFGLSHDAYWYAFDGQLDDLRFYDRPLTDAEIGQVGVPPQFRFDVQPTSQTAFVGDEVILRAAANVDATYQWKLDNVNITGATSNVLTIASAQISNAGTYTVTATSPVGSGTSQPAVLNVVARPNLEASLVAHYPFNAAPVNDVIVDQSTGGTHPGTNTLATWVANVDSRSGVMQFVPDPGSQIVVSPHTDFDTSRGTIAFWIKSPGANPPGEWGSIIFDRRSDVGDVIVLRESIADPVPGALFVQTYGPARVNAYETPDSVSDDQWHHVAYVYDQLPGGKISIYIDGELSHSNTISGPWHWDPAQSLEFGKSHDSYWQRLDGYLDDIRIYNRRLSVAEIAEVMTPGAARPTLNVSRTGNQLTLSWNDPAFFLQEKADLGAAGGWSNVTGNPASPVQITIPASGNKFYRLQRP